MIALVTDEMAELVTVTAASIQDAVKSKEFHLFRGTRHIVCCVTMHCGFTVVGESACADPKIFDLEIGQQWAAEDAYRKIGALLVYEQMCKQYGGQYDH